MATVSRADAGREAERTRQKLLATEAAMVIALRRATRAELSITRVRRGPAFVFDSLESLRARWSPLILQSRRAARVAGAQRLMREAKVFDLALRLPGRAAMAATVAHDQLRAGRASQWLASRLQRRTVAESAGGVVDFDAAVRGAARKLESDFTAVASTENSTAFNAERRMVASTAEVQMLRVWDAELDKLTCEICFGLDGTIVGMGESFPGGVSPGGVHPRCRCVDLIFPAEFRNIYERAA